MPETVIQAARRYTDAGLHVIPIKGDATKEPASLGNTGRAIVAIDAAGCGEGQLVLVVQGSSARMTEVTKNLPADAVIVGIVDSATYAGKTFHQAGVRGQ